mmetsp:Transcript_101948/g.255487  ORF Transcript_101948/g.255487 Transcript_101948/m.255487 type:complete len:208 (-) Transcript_101948:685-1308(-)
MSACSDASARESSSSGSAYRAPSAAALCDNKAKVSASAVAPNVASMSALIGNKLRGSKSAARATSSPAASACRAISRQTVAPNEWPAKKYGPAGLTLRTSCSKSSARSPRVAGHLSLGKYPLGHEAPYTGTGNNAASARNPPACIPAPGTKKNGTPADRSFNCSKSCAPDAAASSAGTGDVPSMLAWAATVSPNWVPTNPASSATVG